MNPSMLQDSDTWFLIGVSFRYCLGRRTYAPSLFVGWAKRYWKELPFDLRLQLKKDLEYEVRNLDKTRGLVDPKYSPLGDAHDEAEWRSFLTWMLERPASEYGN